MQVTALGENTRKANSRKRSAYHLNMYQPFFESCYAGNCSSVPIVFGGGNTNEYSEKSVAAHIAYINNHIGDAASNGMG